MTETIEAVETPPAPPIERERLRLIGADELIFARAPNGESIRLTIKETVSILNLSARAAFPVEQPDAMIELYGTKPDGAVGKAFGMLKNIEALDPLSRALINDAIARARLVPVIRRIVELSDDFHSFRWKVDTDRGEFNFYTGRPREHIQRRSLNKYLITDIDKSRYEIADINALDKQSRKLIEQVI
ncbi:MAG: DUF1854 domain-containing protein [Planctomycetota bacterium]